MTDEKFLAVVRGQAEARAELDLQTFMGYFLAEAIEGMRAALAGGGRQRPMALGARETLTFEVLDAASEGDIGLSTVRYTGPPGAGGFVLKQQWRRVDEAWRVASLERPPELVVPPSPWYRLKSFFRGLLQGPPRGGMRPGMGRMR